MTWLWVRFAARVPMSVRCCARCSIRLERGDVLLGDAYFATYFLFCDLAQLAQLEAEL